MTINRNSVLRLSRYKDALHRLRRIGFTKVYADNLADATGETAARVRKDFSLFGVIGNKKGGYSVDALLDRLCEVLGTHETQNVVVVGAGHIGDALIEYEGLRHGGIRVVAGFDVDPAKFRPQGDVPVLPLSDMPRVVQEHSVRIGIICTPFNAAQQAFDLLILAGVEAILNFAPIRLKGPSNVLVSYVNLVSELENLVYFLQAHGSVSSDAAACG